VIPSSALRRAKMLSQVFLLSEETREAERPSIFSSVSCVTKALTAAPRFLNRLAQRSRPAFPSDSRSIKVSRGYCRGRRARMPGNVVFS
jgi:hypothetical protein